MRAAIAALPPLAQIQIGNSLPIRVIDHAVSDAAARAVITQRGAAGIDGLVASAAGATRAGPTLLVLGEVSFAHDLGGLLAARSAVAPLVILVIDNGGGQIFGGLPVADVSSRESLERHWITPPQLHISTVAAAIGARAVIAATPSEISHAVAAAAVTPGVTVVHAPVAATGACDVRRAVRTATHAIAPQTATATVATTRPATTTAASSTPAAASTFARPIELGARERRLDDLRDAADVAAWRAATPIPL
jgi:2-succinyl-5-enolpyruvyl-6-hydroxy-3-cyclohexene-1-carboxylate synthase